MKSVLLCLFLNIPLLALSQSVKGVVYDAETTVKGAKILNKTQLILSYSDDKGYFRIDANISDTLVFSSLFHHEKAMRVTSNDFGYSIVIELKKITNELDEVEITEIKEKPFDSTAFQLKIPPEGLIIAKVPVLKSGSNLQPTLDVLAIAKLIGKLFKKKKADIPTIKTDDLLQLFTKSSLFTTRFLREELHIEEVHEYLFFEYCSAQNLNPALLTKDNEFLLLDHLLQYSQSFNKLLAAHAKE